jgi:purine-binding chemotaxis protein CheW
MIGNAARETVTTFWLGGLLMGLRASEVREVVQDPTITPVPLLPPVIRGVFNVRGELVTVLDLRRRLGLPDEPMPAAVHLIIPTADGTVSLLVDRQGDVIETDRAAFEVPPTGIAEATRECILGAYKLPGRLLVVLDTSKLLDLRALEDDLSEGRVGKELAR